MSSSGEDRCLLATVEAAGVASVPQLARDIGVKPIDFPMLVVQHTRSLSS